MNKIAAIARREARGVLRERSIFLALLVQVTVAGFSAFLAVGLLGLYDPQHSNGRIVSHVAYSGNGGLDKYIEATDNLRLTRLDANQAFTEFQAGHFGGVVQESVGADGARQITLLVPTSSLQSTLLVTQMRGLLLHYQADLRAAGQSELKQQLLALDVPTGGAPLPFGFVYGVLLPLLVMIPSFLAGSWASDNLVSEVQHGTLALLRSAPISHRQLLWGKVLVPLLLAPAQVAMWALLLGLNGLPVPGFAWLMLLATAWSATLVAIGMVLAVSARRQSAAQTGFAFAVILIGFLSLFLPRDPFNTIALFGTNRPDAATWETLAIWGVLGIAAITSAVAWASCRLDRTVSG